MVTSFAYQLREKKSLYNPVRKASGDSRCSNGAPLPYHKHRYPPSHQQTEDTSLPHHQYIGNSLLFLPFEGWKAEPGRYSSLPLKKGWGREMAVTAKHRALPCLPAATSERCHSNQALSAQHWQTISIRHFLISKACKNLIRECKLSPTTS